MVDWRSVRASGADREQAADLLRAAHGDGRLTWPDYSTRLEHLMSSTTHGEIQDAVADLRPDGMRASSQASGVADGRPDGAPGHGPRHIPGHDVRRPHPMDPAARSRTIGITAASHRTSADRLASAAVVCGTLVPFTVGISGIPAIVLGHLARRRLKNVPEETAGNSVQMATAALVLGYLPVVVAVALVVFLFTR